MSHRVIIINQVIIPSPDVSAAAVVNPAVDHGEMSAEVTYRPADTMTDAQIGNAVERVLKRLTKLADD
jgi:hypothetical protein